MLGMRIPCVSGGKNAGTNEALAWPALKRVIRVETLSPSAKALLPPHKCGGSHLELDKTDPQPVPSGLVPVHPGLHLYTLSKMPAGYCMCILRHSPGVVLSNLRKARMKHA